MNDADVTRDIAILMERDKDFERRLSDVEELKELVLTVKELVIEVRHLGESLRDNAVNAQGQIAALRADCETRFKAHGERLGTMEGKSGKRWDSVVEKILAAEVGAIAAFMIGKLGF